MTEIDFFTAVKVKNKVTVNFVKRIEISFIIKLPKPIETRHSWHNKKGRARAEMRIFPPVTTATRPGG